MNAEAIGRLIRIALRQATTLLSLIAGLVLCGWPLVIEAFAVRRRTRRTGTDAKQTNLLRLIEGGDLESIYRKYQNLDQYFLHLIPGTTGLVVGANWGTTNRFELRLREDYVLVETPYYRWWSGWSAIQFLLRHLRLIRKYQLTLIHANSPYVPGLLGVILSRLTGLPVCVSIHADYPKSESLQGNVIPRILGSLRISRVVERFVYRSADRVLPIRAHMISHLEQAGCRPEKIRVFPHGISLTEPQDRPSIDVFEQFGIPAGSRLICSASRMERENYCDDLVDISLRLVQHHPDVICVLCGAGSQLESLRQRVATEENAERILLPGNVPHETVLQLRHDAQVNLCLMGGFSLIEAAQAGRPVIAYNVEWHHELVESGRTGFLVSEHDIDEVVTRVEELLRDPDTAARMGDAARQRAIDHCSLDQANQTKRAIYRELAHA